MGIPAIVGLLRPAQTHRGEPPIGPLG